MITLNKSQKIFILCPANYATGGPEALHQLGDQLQKMGINALMYYVNYDKNSFESPIHTEYEKYKVPFVLDVENNKDNYILFPETFSTFLWEKEFSDMKKIIWWLSVTNYLISLKKQENFIKSQDKYFFITKYFKFYPIPYIKRLKKENVLHIAHSYFSIDFLSKKKLKIAGQISDYMKDSFLLNENLSHLKDDIIIYNPIKNKDFLEKIIKQTPYLNWIPIKNMSNQEVIRIMQKAKVYIDFGYHPGKERMPREACLMDCCLIIGKEGSAKYKEDMPINDEYHFDKTNKNIPLIIAKIKDCLENYPQKIKDFGHYKQVLLLEKKIFEEAVQKNFKLIS